MFHFPGCNETPSNFSTYFTVVLLSVYAVSTLVGHAVKALLLNSLGTVLRHRGSEDLTPVCRAARGTVL